MLEAFGRSFGSLRPVPVLAHTSTQILGMSRVIYDTYETVFVLHVHHFCYKRVKNNWTMVRYPVCATYSSLRRSSRWSDMSHEWDTHSTPEPLHWRWRIAVPSKLTKQTGQTVNPFCSILCFCWDTSWNELSLGSHLAHTLYYGGKEEVANCYTKGNTSPW